MSLPVSACLVFRAAKGDKEAEAALVSRMEYNLTCGAFTMGGCSHNPPCDPPTDQQLEDLVQRVYEALAALRQKRVPEAKKRLGKFDKFIFPAIKNMPPTKLKDIP